jgi:hypothetical protein
MNWISTWKGLKNGQFWTLLHKLRSESTPTAKQSQVSIVEKCGKESQVTDGLLSKDLLPSTNYFWSPCTLSLLSLLIFPKISA